MAASTADTGPDNVGSASCRLGLLGRFELAGPDGPLDVPGKKLQAMLAYLALNAPIPQRREHLMALLWGNHFDTQARANLRQALSRLRKVLPAGVITGDDDAVSLDLSRIDTDVAAFQSMMSSDRLDDIVAAIGQIRGPTLDGLDTGVHEFDDWIAAQRRRVAALQAAGHVRLAEACREAGEVTATLDHARKAIELAPLREDAHRLAMSAYLALGRRHDGLHQFAELKKLLLDELDTEPEPATVAVADILRAPGSGSAAIAKAESDTSQLAISMTRPTSRDGAASLAQHVVHEDEAPTQSGGPWQSHQRIGRSWWLWGAAAALVCGVTAAWMMSSNRKGAPIVVAGEQTIGADQLVQLLEDVVLEGLGVRSGEPYLVSFARGGLADVENFKVFEPGQLYGARIERGKWWIEGDVLHFRFPRWAQGRLIKRRLTRRGQALVARPPAQSAVMERAFRRSDGRQWGAMGLLDGKVQATNWGQVSGEAAERLLQDKCPASRGCDVTLLEPLQCAARAVGSGPDGASSFTVKTRFAEYTRLVALTKCSRANGSVPCRIEAFVCADGRHRFAGPP